MAKNFYPNTNFIVSDGAFLPFENEKFDIVISSCILLHVPNYHEHIKESVRVSKKYVIAHRTPVTRKHPTQYKKKIAYAAETVELLFNENEIISLFLKCKLKLIKAYTCASFPEADVYTITYVFEKI